MALVWTYFQVDVGDVISEGRLVGKTPPASGAKIRQDPLMDLFDVLRQSVLPGVSCPALIAWEDGRFGRWFRVNLFVPVKNFATEEFLAARTAGVVSFVLLPKMLFENGI